MPSSKKKDRPLEMLLCLGDPGDVAALRARMSRAAKKHYRSGLVSFNALALKRMKNENQRDKQASKPKKKKKS